MWLKLVNCFSGLCYEMGYLSCVRGWRVMDFGWKTWDGGCFGFAFEGCWICFFIYIFSNKRQRGVLSKRKCGT